MTPDSAGCTMWAFDFDGTLSSLVPDRRRAVLHPACGDLLRDLAAEPSRIVAVLSSRALDDLVPRVPLPGLYLGGGSGLEWRFPGGHRVLPDDGVERRLAEARRVLLPVLEGAARLPGVDLEDKGWSAAIHFRHAPPPSRDVLFPRLDALSRNRGIRIFRAPEAAEVPFFPQVDKALGIRRLCRLLGFTPGAGRIAYAGDDENDAAAMRWVLAKGGIALAVGERARVPGVRVVGGPAALAREIRGLVGIPSPGARGDVEREAAP